jgi:2-polyprenyl-3-methyl-5-hydroxy-6-metoxy-1,4-benzoquinol methylase
MGVGSAAVTSCSNSCRVCGSTTTYVGARTSAQRTGYEFHYYHCRTCRYSFIANPLTDYADIYSREYYSGRGADPLTDYAFELAAPEATIRRYEWEGIHAALDALVPDLKRIKWLDFGCGGGGLVRHCRDRGIDIVGFEEGWIAGEAKACGIPILERGALEAMTGVFDVVTAIEVIEHVPEPLELLRQIRRLLKRGGVFFLTTGNAEPWRDRLLEWSYTSVPEVHVSFFEPGTLRIAYEKTGFQWVPGRFLPGYCDIIKFKVLKNLRMRRRSPVHGLVPWSIIAPYIDKKYGISRHPVGIAT